jgi:hypothetical protein
MVSVLADILCAMNTGRIFFIIVSLECYVNNTMEHFFEEVTSEDRELHIL